MDACNHVGEQVARRSNKGDTALPETVVDGVVENAGCYVAEEG